MRIFSFPARPRLSNFHPLYEVRPTLRARPLQFSKGYQPGTIPETLLKSSFFLTHVKKVLDKTRAPSYLDVQERATIVRSPLHPEGVLPVFYYPKGVTCDGHGGGKAHYIIKFEYKKDPTTKSVTLRLGLECAADLASMPGKLPLSEKVRSLFEEFVAVKGRLAQAHENKDTAGLKTETKNFERVKNRLGEALRADNLDQIKKYNQSVFEKEGEGLREKLFSVERRLGLFADDPQVKLAVKQFAMDLKALESLAQGFRANAVYLQKHLVDFFKDVYKKVQAATPELIVWPGYDMGMRTFQHILNSPDFVAAFEAADRDFIAEQLQIYAATFSPESRGQDRLGEMREAAAIRLKNLYGRLPQHGFLTRHALFSQFPEIEGLARIAKEDLKLLPAELMPRAKRIQELLTAIGERHITLSNLLRKKPSREKGKGQTEGDNRARAIRDEDEVPMMGGRAVFDEDESVGRLSRKRVEEVIADLKFLQAHFKRKDEIKKNFPNFERQFRKLQILLPRIEMGNVPASMGAIIDSEAWPALVRKMIHYEQIPDHAFFPVYVCEKVEEIFAKRANPVLHAAADEGFRGLVTRLKFETPKDRKAWGAFMATHGHRLGKRCQVAFSPLAGITDPKTRRGKVYTPFEIGGLRLFDHTLQRKLKRLSDIQKNDAELLAKIHLIRTLNGDWAAGTNTDAAYFCFLFDRGYFDEKLLAFITGQKVVSGSQEVVDLFNLARSALDRLDSWGLPLPKLETDRLRTMIARFENTGAATDRDVQDLRQFVEGKNHPSPTIEDKWTFVAQRLPTFSYSRTSTERDFQNLFSDNRCTPEEKLEILRRVREGKFALPVVRFFERLTLETTTSPEDFALTLYQPDEIQRFHLRISSIRISADLTLPGRKLAIQTLTQLAADLPLQPTLWREWVAKMGEGITHIHRDANKRITLDTHDAAVAGFNQAMREAPPFATALLLEDLQKKIHWPETDKKNFRRIRFAGTLAAARLGYLDQALETVQFGHRKGGAVELREDRVTLLGVLAKSPLPPYLQPSQRQMIVDKLIEALGDMFKTDDGWNLQVSTAAKELIIELCFNFEWRKDFQDKLKLLATSEGKTGRQIAARAIAKTLNLN